MRKALTAIAASSVALFLSLAIAPVAGATHGAQASVNPLAVRITTVDSKPRVKVARKLKVLVSCSTGCRATARLTLKTPDGSERFRAVRVLPEGSTWVTGIQLTNYGLNYLKRAFRQSLLKVAIVAVDPETKKRVSKTRFFRFYR